MASTDLSDEDREALDHHHGWCSCRAKGLLDDEVDLRQRIAAAVMPKHTDAADAWAEADRILKGEDTTS
jgi:hypothetical protein